MIILVGGEKGGSGKTTLVTNIAALTVQEGQDLLLIDTDRQGSASAWCAVRDENKSAKRVASIQKFGEKLGDEIVALKEKYVHILIDAGGQNSTELRTAMTVADKIFVPIQAGQFDIWTLGVMDGLVKNMKIINPKLQAYIVINRGPTNHTSSEVQEVLDVLSDFENLDLAESVIHERIAFRKAAKEGLGVTELSKLDAKACAEMKELYKEVYGVKGISKTAA